MDWFRYLAVQGTLKSLLQHHSSKASLFHFYLFFSQTFGDFWITGGLSPPLGSHVSLNKLQIHPLKENSNLHSSLVSYGWVACPYLLTFSDTLESSLKKNVFIKWWGVTLQSRRTKASVQVKVKDIRVSRSQAVQFGHRISWGNMHSLYQPRKDFQGSVLLAKTDPAGPACKNIFSGTLQAQGEPKIH